MLRREAVSASVVRLTLHRPDRCNALSLGLLRSLAEQLESLQSDSSVRVLLLDAEGNNFCGGLDFQEAVQSDDVRLLSALVAGILVRLRSLPQIVVAAPRGAARAGGAALLAASDIVVAADDLNIAFPEVRRGLEPVLLFPLLRRKLGDSALRDLLFTGLPVSAIRAQQIGLVQRIVPLGSERSEAESLAFEICRGETAAVRTAKELLLAHDTTLYGCSLEDELNLALEAHIKSWHSAAAQRGVAAFLEKRDPAFEFENDSVADFSFPVIADSAKKE